MRKFIAKILTFTVLLIVLALGFELTIKYIVKVPQISNHNIYAKAQNLIPQIDNNTVLFVGDSRVEWGIKPFIVKQNLNNKKLKVINLAVPGSNGIDVLAYLKENNITPKLIIMGYSPNFGKYTNHNYDKQNYNIINKFSENLKYTLNQNSYIYNTNSIKEFLKKNHPYFKHHSYDKYGGAVVTEYGSYNERKVEQKRMYSLWSQSYNIDTLRKFHNTVAEYTKYFNSLGAEVIGLYMPVSKELFVLESIHKETLNPTLIVNKYYNYSEFTYSIDSISEDSTYFYDASHLNQKYAPVFSKRIAKDINDQLIMK